MSARPIQSVAIVGAMGGFGQCFARQFAEQGIQVVRIDTHNEADVVCDVTTDVTPMLARLAQVDVVLLCVSEPVAMAALPLLDAHAREGLLLVDVCSVKSNVCAQAERYCIHSEYLSVHPMFAPSRGFAGNNLVAIQLRAGNIGHEFLQLLRAWQTNVVETDAPTHDRVTSIVQVLTHATLLTFVQAQEQLQSQVGAPQDLINAMATPIYNDLVTVAQGMLKENPTLYHNIQTAGPWGEQVREALIESAQAIAQQVRADAPSDFSALFERLGRDA